MVTDCFHRKQKSSCRMKLSSGGGQSNRAGATQTSSKWLSREIWGDDSQETYELLWFGNHYDLWTLEKIFWIGQSNESVDTCFKLLKAVPGMLLPCSQVGVVHISQMFNTIL